MASKSASIGNDKARGPRPAAAKPVTAHPLFPAYVAFWFAALLSLSSLAVGTANLEKAVGALHLNILLPAAAPPLGVTARVLIAAAMALIGTGFGLFVAGLFAPKKALEVARAPFKWPSITLPSFKWPERQKPAAPVEPPVAVRARDIHPDAPVRRPIFAHEEFGESGESEDIEAVQEMEALRASRGAEPEADLVLPSFLVAPRAAVEPEDRTETVPAWLEPEPVTIEGDFVEAPVEPEVAEPEVPEPEIVELEVIEPEPAEAELVMHKPLPPAPFDMPPGEAAERIASAELTELSPVELLERFAIALQRRQERAGVPLSAEQSARVQAIGEAALALGREALAELDGAARPVAVESAKGLAVVPSEPSGDTNDRPDETEKALREALAALQRMTGTA